jgi:hypothetical protein
MNESSDRDKMNEYLKTYSSLKEDDRKKILAAAKWGEGPFTRMVSIAISRKFPQKKYPL